MKNKSNSKKIDDHPWRLCKHRSKSMKPMKNRWKSLMLLWKHDNFLVHVSENKLAFQRSLESLKVTPGHIWLRKCICEERLSTENVTFWAPSIFQKLRVPDWRVSDSTDSRSNLWFSNNKSMKNRRKSIKNRWNLWIDENQLRSRKFLIPKQVGRGHNVNINIHKRFPRAAGYKLQAAGHRRQAAS